jgi:tetrahydromethanopterin S-methyltransferase subunit G
MRAKFVVALTAISPSAYPADEALVDRLLTLGLGQTVDQGIAFEDRRKIFLAEADREWDHLPEVAERERQYVIFFSRLPDHCRLIVTRSIQGRATFRLIHDNLAELEKNVEWISKELRKRVGSIEGLEVESGRVEVYERGRDNVIMVGRVIDRALWEAIHQNPAELVSAIVTGAASLASLVLLGYVHVGTSSLARGSIERFSTAMISAFFIAAVTLVQRWWRISRQGGVEWRPEGRSR